MSNPFVAILMGSDSDFPVMQTTLDVLKSFDIRYEVKVTSAHRTPAATHAYVTDAEARGCKVFICAAGLAAHLAVLWQVLQLVLLLVCLLMVAH